MKLIIRSNKESLQTALTNSLPGFLTIYEGFSTPKILTEVYHSLRENQVLETLQKQGKPKTRFVDEDYVPNYEIVGSEVSLDDIKVSRDEVVVRVNLIKQETVVESETTQVNLIENKVTEEVVVSIKKVEEKPKKLNRKWILTVKFSEGKTVEESLDEVEREYGIRIDKYYAREIHRDLKASG